MRAWFQPAIERLLLEEEEYVTSNLEKNPSPDTDWYAFFSGTSLLEYAPRFDVIFFGSWTSITLIIFSIPISITSCTYSQKEHRQSGMAEMISVPRSIAPSESTWRLELYSFVLDFITKVGIVLFAFKVKYIFNCGICSGWSRNGRRSSCVHLGNENLRRRRPEVGLI